ncbi:MAG TPA: acetyltransferase [Candidatus Thermoplasmatota archaeon]
MTAAPPQTTAEVVSSTFGNRLDRLEARPSPGSHNSLWYWTKTVPRRKVYRNYLLMRLARATPSLALKNWLYRRMGMQVGKNVSVGLEVTVDIFFPELIAIDDDVIIGYGATLLAHEYLQREYRVGPLFIGRGATVGTKSVVLAGVRIAPGSVVAAFSLVNRDVEGFVGGVPVRPLQARERSELPPRARG